MNIIRSRPVIADKLQLHVSPEFLSIDDETELYYDGHLFPFFTREIQQLYGSKITYFNGVKKTSRPYLQLPNDFNPLTSRYILNNRVCLRKPFTVVSDLNLIRNILFLIENDPDSGYDKTYHKSIQLHDDNFIDKKIWSKWDDILIFDLTVNLKDKILKFANNSFGYLVDDHELIYSVVSLKYAEFNIDYYVSSKNSLALILAYQHWITSDRGRQWRSEIQSMSMVQRSTDNDFDRSLSSQDGHDGHTSKFYIAKGLSIKVYQKSDDHIRVEFVFEGSFIQQRFHTYKFDVVYPRLYEFSTELFKEINFEGVLYLLSKEGIENRNNIETKIVDFLEKYDSELLSVVNSIIHEQTISDRKTVNRICTDPKLRRLFNSVNTEGGHRAYSYDPYHRDKRYRQRLKPPSKKKMLPAQCGNCKAYYHTDLVRCPYCAERNLVHALSKDSGFTDFMTKVNRYKEGGYTGV